MIYQKGLVGVAHLKIIADRSFIEAII